MKLLTKKGYVIGRKLKNGDIEPFIAVNNNGEQLDAENFTSLVDILKNELENILSERLSVVVSDVVPDKIKK